MACGDHFSNCLRYLVPFKNQGNLSFIRKISGKNQGIPNEKLSGHNGGLLLV